MSSRLTAEITRNDTRTVLTRYGQVMRKPLQQVVTRFAKSTVRELINITPPASEGSTGRDAYNQGRSKIHRDMLRVLAPRTLKHQRKERFPDVASTYYSRRVFRNNGVGARTSRGVVAYVDRTKFLAFEKILHGRIGRLASGWSAAANELGVATPAWISRHGQSRGAIKVQSDDDGALIVITNFSPTARGNIRFELRRRIPYAMRYALNGMSREAKFVALKCARSSGL